MATVKLPPLSRMLSGMLDYVLDKDKTKTELISGVNISTENIFEQMEITKKAWGKTGGRQYKHIIQSFPASELVTAEEVHQYGLELAKKFIPPGFQYIVVTHINKKHLHNHIIINSVNTLTGKKFHDTNNDLLKLRQLNDEVCKAHGLSIPKKSNTITSYKRNKYESIQRACHGDYKSYLVDCACAVTLAKRISLNKQSFISNLQKIGIKTTWSSNRKYIVFTDSLGHKFRNSNLEKTFKEPLDKKSLMNAFAENLAVKNYAHGTDTITHNPDIIHGNISVDISALAKSFYGNIRDITKLNNNYKYDEEKPQNNFQAVEKAMAEFSDTMSMPTSPPVIPNVNEKDKER
jgi:hypothetical protein